MLSKPTRLEQQQVVLKLFGYRFCDAAAKAELEQKAQRVARLSTLPIFILREIFQCLTQQRVLAPGYTYLQDLADCALRIYKTRGGKLEPTHGRRPAL